ncbi:MAG: DUF4416 family protein [Planctomycetaceae bacterium]|jgi:hypothetical protein|nr:DUF4416 family protein [Planctomycetaceae bacterium]
MGEIRRTPQVLLILAVFSRHEILFKRIREQAEHRFGPVALESPPFLVDTFTDYYAAAMGMGLTKTIWAFRDLFDPGELADVKILTNTWEENAADTGEFDEPRPLNLDPGYLDLGKLVLASTKDHGHRIYLQKGIFAEITLSYTQKKWTALPWSYADYQSRDVTQFLEDCRHYLHSVR